MFRIVCDPSSGSVERALLKLLVIFFVCVVGVWQRDFEPAVCVLGATSWELLTSNFGQARSTLPDDGSQTIRNMSE